MPAPGEQHIHSGGRTIANPFEEAKPRISEYTAQEIATLQSRLEKQLGPEYISSRAGPSGQKVHYVAAEKCIQLANEVFGFNGWSSSIINIQVDFVTENPTTFKVSLGISVIVRVTLRDGTYHEDIGYGKIENCKSKAAAFEKAKKEGTTDALKRALKNFGNVLGNCIYDKEYLAKVTKVKVAPTKWDVDRLYRHADYAPIKREAEAPIVEDIKTSELSGTSKSTWENGPKILATEVSYDCLDDEFGDFDEADFGVSHDSDNNPDEVALPAGCSRHFPAEHSTNGPAPVHVAPHRGEIRHNLPNLNGKNVATNAIPQTAQNGSQVRLGANSRNGAQQMLPKDPLPSTRAGLIRSTSGASASAQMRPPQDISSTTKVVQPTSIGPGRVLNQPSRTEPFPTIGSPTAHQNPAPKPEPDTPSEKPLPALGSGLFYSARAAMQAEAHDATGVPPLPPGNLPTFNPHAESPSIRKTPGVDHTKSKPLNRDLKHVPGSTQIPAAAPNAVRTNVVNPQMDATRRIGAPGSPSPIANRSSYKAPTMKRAIPGQNLGRPPLNDIHANGMVATAVVDGGPDLKRQRVSGP